MTNKHGNDSLIRTTVEKDSFIAIIWHIFGFIRLIFY